MIPTNDKLINPIIMGKIFFTLFVCSSKDNMFLQRSKNPANLAFHNPGHSYL